MHLPYFLPGPLGPSQASGPVAHGHSHAAWATCAQWQPVCRQGLGRLGPRTVPDSPNPPCPGQRVLGKLYLMGPLGDSGLCGSLAGADVRGPLDSTLRQTPARSPAAATSRPRALGPGRWHAGPRACKDPVPQISGPRPDRRLLRPATGMQTKAAAPSPHLAHCRTRPPPARVPSKGRKGSASSSPLLVSLSPFGSQTLKTRTFRTTAYRKGSK